MATIGIHSVFGFVSASNAGTTSIATGVVTGLNPAGAFGICGVTINHATVTCSSVTDTQGNTWIKLGERKHATLAIYEALFICLNCIGGANNNLTANFSGATSADTGIKVASYTGVSSYRPVATTAEGNSAQPSISITTHDNNDWVVMVAGHLANGVATAISGNLRISDQNVTITQVLMDNTSATPAAVTDTVNNISGGWAAVGIELRSIPSVDRRQFTHAENVATATSIVSPSMPGITAGSLVAVHVRFDNTGGITCTSVRDDLAVDAAFIVAITEGTDSIRTEIWYFKNYGGGTRTFTAAFSSTGAPFRHIEVEELIGADTVSPLGPTNSATTLAATTGTAGSVTPTRDGSYISGLAGNASFAETPTAPMLDVFQDNISISDSSALAQGVAAAVNPTWTTVSSANWAAVVAVFMPAASVTVGPDTSRKPPFPAARLLIPCRPFGANNPLREMKWNEAPPPTNITYTQSLDAALSFVGDFFKMTSRALPGATTPAGAMTKRTQRALSGGSTPAGSLLNRTQRALTGAFASAGVLAASKVSLKTLTGATTPAGALVRNVFKTLTGATTPAGALVRQTWKSLTGATTPAGALTSSKLQFKTLTGATTPTGSLFKRFPVNLSGVVASVGDLIRQTKKTLAGGVTPTGATIKQTWRTLTGAIASSSVVTTIKAFTKQLTGATTPTGALSRQSRKIVDGNTTPAGALIRNIFKTLTGASTPTGALLKQVRRSLTGAIASSGAMTTIKAFTKQLTGAFASAGVLSIQTKKSVAGTIASAGALAKSARRNLVGAIASSSVLTTIRTRYQSLTGTTTPTGTLVRKTWKTVVGAIAPVGTFAYTTTAHTTYTVLRQVKNLLPPMLARHITPNMLAKLLDTSMKAKAPNTTPFAKELKTPPTAKDITPPIILKEDK